MAKTKRTTNAAVTPAVVRKSKSLPNRLANVTGYDIARRAYELYLARHGKPGHDLDDWLQAEQELRDAVSSTAT